MEKEINSAKDIAIPLIGAPTYDWFSKFKENTTLTNAGEELEEMLNELNAKRSIPMLCATVTYNDKTYNLSLDHTYDDYKQFFDELKKISYDAGYGMQNLYGIVWLSDNAWLERCEYDGSEWWEYKVCPKIPERLIKDAKERE